MSNELNYPYSLDALDRRIVQYVGEHPNATAPEIRAELDITEIQCYHRLKMMTLAGLLKVDATAKRRMMWSLSDDGASLKV
jgi:hypothetical protein